MPPAAPSPVKHVFLDIVGFTHQRSVETQAHIVGTLNQIVTEASSRIGHDDLLFLPTGDGMAICLVGASPYDSHLRAALQVLKDLDEYNASESLEARKFGVRIGINENTDNIIDDINDRRNVAGAGINYAARLMNLADEGQILVSSAAHDALSVREAYMNKFRRYAASVKHGLTISAYQYIDNTHEGLSCEEPSALRPRARPATPLSEFCAYYVATALKLRDAFIAQGIQVHDDSAMIMCWFIAKDMQGLANQTEFSQYHREVLGRGTLSLSETFEAYNDLDIYIQLELAKRIRAELGQHRDLFETDSTFTLYAFPTSAAGSAVSDKHPHVLDSVERNIGLDL